MSVAVAGAALSLLGVAGCNRNAAAQPPAANAPIVSVTTAVTRDVPVYLDEPIGKAVATESVTVQPQVTGLLTARHFVDGADVHTGQLLFEIDPRPFQAALDQAKANLAQAKAALEYAQNDYQRYLNLKGTPAVSQEEIEQKENTVEVDEANVKANDAAVETAQVNLDYCKIASPIDGRAGERLVDVGNVVTTLGGTSGATNLLTIQKLDPIYVDFTVTEAELARVQQYMGKGTLAVMVQTPADAALASAPPTTAPAAAGSAAAPFKPRTGKLIFLDNTVQDGSGTVKLRAELPNADHHFWPGQYASVRLILTTKPSVLIPANAAQISQQGLFVYKVVNNPNSPTKAIAAMQPVTLGQRHGDMVVVEQGLSAGDVVVSSGFTLLQPDSPIMVINPPAPGTAAPNNAAPKTTPDTLQSPQQEGERKAGPQASAAHAASEGSRS